MARGLGEDRLPASVWIGAGSAVALLLAVSGRYGFHRDELYFVVAGRRLDWGFVDQPPLTPLVARISETVAGTNPTALRILPALAVGMIAVLAAAITRRFGGGRVAQVFAASTTGFTGVLLGEGHLLSTAVFDYAFWVVSLWILVRLVDGADPRWWLALGATVGIGLQNKHTIAFLAVAVLVSLLITDRRRLLASPFPWAGAAIALLIALPNLIWQATNGWPQLEVAGALRARSDGPLAFILLQPLLLSVTLAIPAAAGLWWLGRSSRAAPWRVIPIAFGLLFVTFLLTGGKAYYVAPMYPALLAGGAIWFEGLSRLGRRWVTGLAAVGVAVGLLVALPLLPVDQAGALDATGELGETVGWPDLIDQIEVAYEMIPAEARDDAVVFTGTYGEAGAVDVLGRNSDLPAAASGHNNYWLWGPPATNGPIIGVGFVEGELEPICPDIVTISTLGNPHGVENEVVGQPLLLCLNPSGRLAEIWDSLRHFN
ncbi:MAG TPA: glycosyltransferase family 39 protein [Acidimicrobiia bacterium]|nr:glycosyltransferase family 39 protein [Acidimicrobiia bacterium]